MLVSEGRSNRSLEQADSSSEPLFGVLQCQVPSCLLLSMCVLLGLLALKCKTFLFLKTSQIIPWVEIKSLIAGISIFT